MANAGIALATIFLVILSAIFIVIILSALISDSVDNTNDPVTVPACTSFIPQSELINIPEIGARCVTQGNLNQTLYYIGNLGDQTYDYVVSPWPNQPELVCASYCSPPPKDGVCTGPIYAGRTAQENYDICLTQLIPNDCEPPVPLAVKGITEYFAYIPTSLICQSIE